MANNKSRRTPRKSVARLPFITPKNKTKSKSKYKAKSKSPPKNALMSNNFGNIPPPPQLRRY